jgi:hypothetical protein
MSTDQRAGWASLLLRTVTEALTGFLSAYFVTRLPRSAPARPPSSARCTSTTRSSNRGVQAERGAEVAGRRSARSG